MYLCTNNYSNKERFDKVITQIKWCSFLPQSVVYYGTLQYTKPTEYSTACWWTLGMLVLCISERVKSDKSHIGHGLGGSHMHPPSKPPNQYFSEPL